MNIDINGILCMKWSTLLETLSNLINDEIISLVKVGCYFSISIKTSDPIKCFNIDEEEEEQGCHP